MKHKQELIDILMADAKLQHYYADEEGNTCAIGGMAAAFGWEPRPLRETNRGQNNGTGVAEILHSSFRMIPPLKRAINHFALTEEQVVAIQKTNDKHRDTDERHFALKELVESWEEE